MSTPTSTAPRTFVIGSRASKLAVIQAEIVHAALTNIHPEIPFTLSYMSTEGDKNQSQALYLMGGKALWTKELEVGLLDGDIDLIVHSLKDVPTALPDGCELGAIMEREDPSDCLVVKDGLDYKTLEEFPDGSVIGTSSVRRVAQLRRTFPKLRFADVRGNLNTRLAKLDRPDSEYSALVLAAAGLQRLGFTNRITCLLTPPTLFHAVGQAALGVEIRSNDLEAKKLIGNLTHLSTNLMCRAERACLRVLEGGCSVPVGMSTAYDRETHLMSITGTVTSLPGTEHVECSLCESVLTQEDAEGLGEKLAHKLKDLGAQAILDGITVAKSEKMQQEVQH